MREILLDCILYINKFFPQKHHPFHDLKDGIENMNYTDFEYSHAQWLLDQYKQFTDLNAMNWKNILEIWSGWGGKIIYFAEKYNADCTWIDINQHFLTQAQNKAEEIWVTSRVRFLEMDALNMSFEDNSFDYIVMSDVLEHIPNTKKLLSEVLRVTKEWGSILFDFAPYGHYFWHHIWDTVRIPWLHLWTTDNFRADLYEKSLEWFPDKAKRLALRVSGVKGNRKFTYLNNIYRKDFEKIIAEYEEVWIFKNCTISYFMLKNIDIFSKIPLIREIFIRHIVWVIKK